jgi:cytochrome P450 family 20 subfamily A
MLSYVVFGFTCVVGLVVILLFLYWSKSEDDTEKQSPPSGTSSTGTNLQTEDIPGWKSQPADESLGDTPVMAEHGSLHQYLFHRHTKEGPIIAFWMPNSQRVVSIAAPELFRDTVKLFDRPECMFELFRPLITSDSIQYANYEDGRNRRSVYDPAFQHKAIQSYFHVFVECAEEFVTKYDNPEARKNIPLKEDCFALTIKSMCRSSLGDIFSNDNEVKTISTAYHKCWGEMESRLGGDFPEEGSEKEQQFEKDKELFYGLVKRIVDARKNSSDTSKDLPFIDALLSAHLPEEATHADVVSYLIGGFHTSGYFMVWILYYLGRHPEVQEKVYREIVSVLGDGEVTFDAVKDLKYLRQVQDEVLRLSTLAPYAARFSEDDITVGGYPIPAMTPIVHALGVVSADEKIWSSPEEFNPDRFAPEAVAMRQPNSFVPFGFGKRICPGYIFSYIEVATFLAMLLRKYSVTMVSSEPVEKMYGLVTSPKEEILFNLHPRDQ